jgi:hypothetical protein
MCNGGDAMTWVLVVFGLGTTQNFLFQSQNYPTEKICLEAKENFMKQIDKKKFNAGCLMVQVAGQK